MVPPESDYINKVSQGAQFVSTATMSLFGANINERLRKQKIIEISKKIQELIREKKTITIPEIMSRFNINAAEAIEAIEILVKQGLVREIDSSSI